MENREKVLELFEKHKDYIKERSNDCIENYRKGNAVIKLVDKNGIPLKNVKIHLNQTKHKFKYGANLFMLDELESKEKNDLYKKYMSEFCNIATLPFYWDATEPEKGKTRYDKDSVKVYRRPPIDLCVEFCKDNGIEPREHALAYEAFFPKWLYGASVEETKKELEKRYGEISERYADKIPTIEVTNEMEWANGKTEFYNSPDFIEWCFKTAEKYFPNNQLVINEYTSLCWEDKGRFTDKYYSYIDATIHKGAKVDAIGMQYHQFFKREDEYTRTRMTYDPVQLFKHMDLYANLGKPLQITEVTIPAYSWEKDDEEIQAKIIEYLYTIWFGHPSVEQIIYWNMVDGYAHLWSSDPEKIKQSQGDMTIGENYYHGGLLRFDLSPKPAYYVIKNLFEKVWHTEEDLTTNENGEISFKGFFGDYEVDVNDRKIAITLDKDCENIILEL